MKHDRSLAAVATVVLAALFGLGTAAPASAQEVGSVQGHAGIGFPAGELLTLQDAGPAFGLSGAYWVTERVGLRAGGDLQIFSGADAEDLDREISGVPDITTFHFHGGVELRLAPPEETRWDVRLNAGAGGTSITSDDFPSDATAPADGPDFSKTYFSLNTGVRVGYQASDRLNLFLLGQGFFAFADSDDTQVFAQFDDDVDQRGFGDVWSVPLQGGVEVRF